MPDTWIDPVADELAADIVRDQQLAEQERRIYRLENEIRELQLWRTGIYHTSRPTLLVKFTGTEQRYSADVIKAVMSPDDPE